MTNKINRMERLKRSIGQFPQNVARIVSVAQELGFLGIIRAVWSDLFVGRTVFQWVYLIVLSSVPLVLEYTNGSSVHDFVGLFAAWTGIVCVIMVAEGRASNYFFGFLNSVLYLALSYQNMFYGEVMTALFFIIMQPVGLYFWLVARIIGVEKEESREFKARKLDLFGWLKWLSFTACVWVVFGLVYQSVGSARPFRDSITDGTNWTGQFLMTYLYREQWLFWIATNLFSIYLWWGSSIHIQAMYWVYALNSIVGWYQWSKTIKQAGTI